MGWLFLNRVRWRQRGAGARMRGRSGGERRKEGCRSFGEMRMNRGRMEWPVGSARQSVGLRGQRERMHVWVWVSWGDECECLNNKGLL